MQHWTKLFLYEYLTNRSNKERANKLLNSQVSAGHQLSSQENMEAAIDRFLKEAGYQYSSLTSRYSMQ